MTSSTYRLSRGAKSFIREIVIVVAGVLIALVLQEWASDLRDRKRTSAVQASMRQEIADFTEILSLRNRARPCIEVKLNALDEMLRQSGASGPWANVGRPSYFFSSQGAWNSTSSDLLSSALSPEIFRSYGEIYQGIDRYAAVAQREQEDWIILQTLERQNEPIAGERRWRLVQAVAGARNEALIMNAIAEQMTELAKTLSITPSGALRSMKVRSTPLCRNLSKVAGN
jgi:type II secretory pathway pseudopilin PulG